MTMADNYLPVKQLGNGTTVEFSFSWRAIAKTFVKVYLESVATGEQVLQVEGSDYTLTLTDSGGVVEFDSAPTSENYALITRDIPLEQGTPYRTSKGFDGRVVEDSFDIGTGQIQALNDKLARCLVFPVGSSSRDVTLPVPLEGKALLWGSDGNISNSTDDFDDIVTDATAQAVLAQGYATASAGSASTATTQAGLAEDAKGAALVAQSAAEAAAASIDFADFSALDDGAPLASGDKFVIERSGTGDKQKLSGSDAGAGLTPFLDVNGQTAKTVSVDADELILSDSEDTNAIKKLALSDLKTYIGAGGGGAWEVVDDYTVPASPAVTSIEYTGLSPSATSVYKLLTVADDGSVGFQFSTDDGSNWLSGANSYTSNGTDLTMVFFSTANSEVDILGVGATSVYPRVQVRSQASFSSVATAVSERYGGYKSAISANAFRILGTSGGGELAVGSRYVLLKLTEE